MGDDKNGREKQARDAERRQRERALATELERGDEPEPPIDDVELAGLDAEFESLSFPVTGAEIVTEIGTHKVRSVDETYVIADLIPETDVETFDSPARIRERVHRPTVAAAMKRIVEATAELQDAKLRTSQRDAYERTFRELRAIDEVDEDEGIGVIADWIVDRIHTKEKLPGSRDVRRQAAKFCRQNGYQVRNDEWLGV